MREHEEREFEEFNTRGKERKSGFVLKDGRIRIRKYFSDKSYFGQ